MQKTDGRRILFREAIDAMGTRYPSARARRSFERFKDKYLSGCNEVALTLRHPIVSHRYFREQYRIMRDANTAIKATPVTSSMLSLTGPDSADAKKAAYKSAHLADAAAFGLLAITAASGIAEAISFALPSFTLTLSLLGGMGGLLVAFRILDHIANKTYNHPIIKNLFEISHGETA